MEPTKPERPEPACSDAELLALLIRRIREDVGEEAFEWMRMTPQERIEESGRMWEMYRSLGGSLDPQPDSQSPFDFPELERALPSHGRAGVRDLRSGGVHS